MAPDAPSAPPPAGRSRPLWRHLLLGPTRLLLFILLVTGIGGLPLAVFGITWRDAFRWRFWEGSVWGFAAVAALVGMIALGGGYYVRSFALHGADSPGWRFSGSPPASRRWRSRSSTISESRWRTWPTP